MSEQNWRVRAACRNHDPELHFPPGGDTAPRGGAALRQENAAKQVCAACPVARECLTWALDTGQRYGIWGAATEQERDAMLRGGGRSSRRSADVEPSIEDELDVLARLDGGYRVEDVHRRTGHGAAWCRTVWRRHRGDITMPAHARKQQRRNQRREQNRQDTPAAQ